MTSTQAMTHQLRRPPRRGAAMLSCLALVMVLLGPTTGCTVEVVEEPADQGMSGDDPTWIVDDLGEHVASQQLELFATSQADEDDDGGGEDDGGRLEDEQHVDIPGSSKLEPEPDPWNEADSMDD